MASPDWHMYAAAGMPDRHPQALDGVWAKMHRAAAHQAALSEAIAAYLSQPPYRRSETTDGDLMTVRAEATLLPPDDLALIFGDMVQNLRSALDHMSWAFALTVEADPSRRTQFPILHERPDDFSRALQVKHIPDPVRAIMEEMQPYQPEDTIGGMIGRELATLASLSNRDKHRLLVLAERLVVPQYVAHSTPTGVESRITMRGDPEGQWAEVIHPADLPHGPYDVHFEAEVTIIEPGMPWRSGLEGIARHLWNEASMVIGAFRGQWPLLVAPTRKV